jgi:hypothetical protein
MKYLTFIRHAESYRQAGPPRALMEAMGQFVQKSMKDGTLVETGGLLPSKEGARIRLAGGKLMDRKTARKYVAAGKLPSEMTVSRDWRTREDPFAEHWPEVEALVRETPALEAKTLFEVLSGKYPDRYEAGQLRTLQRRVRVWRATQGPDRAVTFAQQHRPGEAAQTEFTSTSELGVTIAGQLFAHLLCVFVLPFSNWLWATVCLSESMAALRKDVQRALFQLGRVRATTRPTTPRRRRTEFPMERRFSTRTASVPSTTTTSRSCVTSG